MNKIFQPFTIIFKIKSIFTLWVLFTIVMGLSGVILSLSISFKPVTWEFIVRSGTFYSIGIAMCSSFVSIFLADVIKNNKNLTFINYKIVCAALGVIIMIFMAGLYASLMSGGNHNYKFQYIFYFSAIVLAVYAFYIENLNLHYDDYKELDDLAVSIIISKSEIADTDKDGNKL